MTNEQRIEAIVADMENWSEADILAWAQDERIASLSALEPEDVAGIYDDLIGDA